jgi:nitrite reductase (NO-forming)/hydroxylamine reductase
MTKEGHMTRVLGALVGLLVLAAWSAVAQTPAPAAKAAPAQRPAPKAAPAPAAAKALPAAAAISREEFERGKQIFFERCAGCHGVLRKGATGPHLLPEKTRAYGTIVLSHFITNGTGGGMPDWGRQGILSPQEINLMARYLQQEPPVPPEMSLAQMKASWKVFIPPDQRPTRPLHTRDWENFFALTLRDAGQVAIIDGATKEIVSIVQTGYAVHISRTSGSGRYVYTIGRDGKATMIDLWME